MFNKHWGRVVIFNSLPPGNFSKGQRMEQLEVEAINGLLDALQETKIILATLQGLYIQSDCEKVAVVTAMLSKVAELEVKARLFNK